MKAEKRMPLPKRMMDEQFVIVFGTRLLADQWAKANHTDPSKVVLATEPDRIQGLVGPFIIVRYPKDVWTPSTFPCEQRVRSTEDWILKDQQLRSKR